VKSVHAHHVHMCKRYSEAMKIPFSSSARTVCESELAFQADGISRMDSGW
jgi:hypothetical protein